MPIIISHAMLTLLVKAPLRWRRYSWMFETSVVCLDFLLFDFFLFKHEQRSSAETQKYEPVTIVTTAFHCVDQKLASALCFLWPLAVSLKFAYIWEYTLYKRDRHDVMRPSRQCIRIYHKRALGRVKSIFYTREPHLYTPNAFIYTNQHMTCTQTNVLFANHLVLVSPCSLIKRPKQD